VARTSGDPGAFAGTVQRVIWEVDPSSRIYELSTVDQILARAVFLPRLSTTLLTLFALAALLLAALGIYGVLSYSVSERTKEIGLRLALGSTVSETVGLIVRQSITLVAVGGAVGLLGSLLLARSLAGVLYGIGPFDVPAFVMATAGLLVAGVGASLVPALRTTRVDPMIALREQ
jgi:ABC-type antimicrobial peptide transport system permease subunit